MIRMLEFPMKVPNLQWEPRAIELRWGGVSALDDVHVPFTYSVFISVPQRKCFSFVRVLDAQFQKSAPMLLRALHKVHFVRLPKKGGNGGSYLGEMVSVARLEAMLAFLRGISSRPRGGGMSRRAPSANALRRLISAVMQWYRKRPADGWEVLHLDWDVSLRTAQRCALKGSLYWFPAEGSSFSGVLEPTRRFTSNAEMLRQSLERILKPACRLYPSSRKAKKVIDVECDNPTVQNLRQIAACCGATIKELRSIS